MDSVLLGRYPRLSNKTPHVLVVGAGLSGLALATELRALGFSVKIFEARDRVGGRVHSAPWAGGHTIDIGAELVGRRHKLVLRYAELFGVERTAFKQYQGPFSPIILEDIERAEKIFQQIKLVEETLTADSSGVALDAPWETFHAQELDFLSVAEKLQQLKLPDAVLRTLFLQLMANQGVTAHALSYLGFLTLIAQHGGATYWTETENFRFHRGAEELAKGFVPFVSDYLSLNSPVAAVQATKKQAIVTTKAGEIHRGDEVVVTVPPNLWSALKITPKLPAGVTPQMGYSAKIIVALDSTCIAPEGLNGAAARGRSLLQVLWKTVPGDGEVPTALVCFLGGEKARAFVNLSPEARLRKTRQELERMSPGIGRSVQSIQVYDWPNEPWTRAGYSCPAPGDVTTKWPWLRQGFGRMHLAGEALSNYWGFMEGALDSGVRVAERIYRKYA